MKILRPLADRVLVKRMPSLKPAKSLGGIILPDSGKETKVGIVLMTGPGRYQNSTLIKPTVKGQDIVLLPDFGGVPVEASNEKGADDELVMYREDELVAIVDHSD